jgi:SAM-dependent methyltransferase
VAKGRAQAEAAAHYNQLRRDKRSRNESIINHMRRLNNWVKAQLIGDVRPAAPHGRDVEVLDLACGKGGDFFKWRGLGQQFPIARYVGVDIARASLDDAIGRYLGDGDIRRALGSAVTLACADLGADDLTTHEVEVWDALEQQWEMRTLLDEHEQFDGGLWGGFELCRAELLPWRLTSGCVVV